MAQPTILRGMDVKIFINGLAYPEAQSVSYVEDRQDELIYGIDNVFAQEIISNKYSVQGRISGLQLKDDKLSTRQIVAKYHNILSAPYISILIKDRHSGATLVEISRASVDRKSFEVNAKGLAKVTISFKAIFSKPS